MNDIGSAKIISKPLNIKMAPTTSTQKYVSMFRIDGFPILPPLMTQEKRRQMQKLKDKAVKVEQRLEECRRRRERSKVEYKKRDKDQNDHVEVLSCNLNSTSSSSTSELETELDAQQKEVDDSYMILSDILTQNKEEIKSLTPNRNVYYKSTAFEACGPDVEVGGPLSSGKNRMQRMQKLKKSDTLIYDHGANTFITPLREEEVQIFQQQQQQINLDHSEEKPIRSKVDLNGIEDGSKNVYLDKLKGNKFTSFTDKSLKKIPSICIDPPTPINTTRTFSADIQARNSIDAVNLNSHENPVKDLTKTISDELSSDDSYNSIASTKNFVHDLKNHKKVTKIASKILKFENFSTSEPNKCSPTRSNITPPQRSATSPSFKTQFSDRKQPTNKTFDKTLALQNENVLVRSNSFTLDYPSKALMEHIRQQQSPNNNYTTKRSNFVSTSITRDTVESKAKRVQKVDLKPRTAPARLQLKPSSTNIASPSISYQGVIKNKRSPYESKSIKAKSVKQLKKSISSTTAIKQMKPRPSMPTIQPTKFITENVPLDGGEVTTANETYSSIEAEHRKKFVELLAHQKREQRRMQQVFEEQQQYLLEQLNAKISSVQIQPTAAYGSGKVVDGNDKKCVDHSPNTKSEYNESTSLQSPTVSINSNVACELPSLELSICSSTLAATSQSSNRCTPRRRLFSRDMSPSASSRSLASLCSNNGGAVNCVGSSNGSTPGLSSSRLKTAELNRYLEAKRREAAATKINAYVRGYLVRRLFQTEQIQRIVQTIKDTLIFVLNLHIETFQDPAEANSPINIKLKTQLVKQLTSAIRTLHLLLFNTSVKERMEIISRDRKRIKTKMLTMSMKRPHRFQT